jgi:hypothetical protein
MFKTSSSRAYLVGSLFIVVLYILYYLAGVPIAILLWSLLGLFLLWFFVNVINKWIDGGSN